MRGRSGRVSVHLLRVPLSYQRWHISHSFNYQGNIGDRARYYIFACVFFFCILYNWVKLQLRCFVRAMTTFLSFIFLVLAIYWHAITDAEIRDIDLGPWPVQYAEYASCFPLLKYLHLTFVVFREAAKECRRKKKEYVKCLENRVAVLENQNKTLIEELKALKDLYCHKADWFY